MPWLERILQDVEVDIFGYDLGSVPSGSPIHSRYRGSAWGWEMYRVLRPGGRVLIHDTDWGTLLCWSSDAQRMARVMAVWDKHLTDPHLPQTLGSKLRDAGFSDIKAEPIVQLETEFDPGSVSGVLMRFIVGYVESQGIPAAEASAWKEDLENLGAAGDYFFSSNEYVFVGRKPV